jgi:two-component sensor histidine kinase
MDLVEEGTGSGADNTHIDAKIPKLKEQPRRPAGVSSAAWSDLHREMFKQMNSGVIIYRAIDDGDDFEIVDLNPAVERIEQVRRNQIVGRRVTEVFPTIAAFGLLDVLNKVWSSGVPAHHPLTHYSDERISGWRDNRVFRLSTGEVVAIYDDRTREVEIGQAEALRELLASELNHRLLNAAHVVEVIVRESLKSQPTLAKIINQRIRAGMAGLDIQGRAAREPVSLRALLKRELVPFGRGRISLHGPPLPLLPARLRTIVSLATHELATNAVKYGALSNDSGRVSITWRMNQQAVRLRWRETGGPPVRPPEERGFGSMMLHRLVDAAGGALDTRFEVEGFVAQFLLPRSDRASTMIMAEGLPARPQPNPSARNVSA